MIKKMVAVSALLLCSNIFANVIHETTIESPFCGNLSLSTKLGNKNDTGQCQFVKETHPEGKSNCETAQLQGRLLEIYGGMGFTCAATRVHSNTTGEDGYDYFDLILDTQGHYVGTSPHTGHVVLKLLSPND